MNLRRLLFLHALLIVLCVHTVYVYIDNEVMMSYRLQGEAEFKDWTRNPLEVIFIGQSSGEYKWEHGVEDRLLRFTALAFVGLLLISTTRYFISRRKKTGALMFSLTAICWIEIAKIIFPIFYYAWSLFYPDQPVVTNSFHWMKLISLTKCAALIFMIRSLQQEKFPTATGIAPQYLPLRWMRGFHVMTDRLLILIFSYNAFVWSYYNSKSNGRYNAGPFELTDQFWIWALLSLVAGSLVAYLLAEGVLRLSPAKVLTGTTVADAATGRAPGWGNLVARTCARLIPLDELSFFGNTGWHDKLSGTKLQYNSPEEWLHRQSRLVRSIFFLFLLIALWTLVSTSCQLSPWRYASERAAAFPQFLLVVTFPFMLLLSICYMASVSNLAHNLTTGQSTHSNIHFTSALLCWVPVLNFRMPGTMLYEAAYGLTRHDPDLAEKYNGYTRIFCRVYGLAYTLLFFGIFIYIAANSRTESILGACITASACSVWCLAMIIYAGKLKVLQLNVIYPARLTEI